MPAPAQAQWETLPPDHWAYDEVRWLQTLGYLHDLDPSQKPYTRREIALALNNIEGPLSGMAGDRVVLLLDEFANEMGEPSANWHLFAGGRINAGLESCYNAEGREAGFLVANVGAGNKRMGIFTAIRADRDLSENPLYKGKIYSNFAGLSEQAYFMVVGENSRWSLKLGRDHLYWGPGQDHLLLNYNRRGIDQINVQARWGWGRFTALIGQVDDFEDSTGSRTSRFLSGHRLEISPWPWLRMGLSETLLFTGDVRFGSMNPFVPYYGELVNETSEGNGLMGFDFVVYPAVGTEIFGELLLDDIQLEKNDSKDLEPNEWGWLIGGRWSGVDGLLGVGLTYSGVANRTYNALEPKYRYQNYGLPLGSELGNDADRLRFDFSIWPQAGYHANLFWEVSRQGEGRVTAPFDTTYLAYTVEEGYDEPFPTGTVQKTMTVGLELNAWMHPNLQIEGWLGHDWTDNYLHEEGREENGLRGRVTAVIRFDHLLVY
ncbi:capsule assembly Wzi family protein [bacterium]|nr:capsule assembly Wzi family protein [bacterium]MBU1882578.1 capsule assembly Wzi family protein [bacterium]